MKPSKNADEYINSFTDWRGEQLRALRDLISSVEGLKEEIKWGVPVWTCNGLVCAISAFKDHVKMNFLKGAQLADQSMFNNGLDSKDHRSIDWAEGDKIDAAAIKKVVEAAKELNK